MTNTTGRVRARRLMAAALSTLPRKVVTWASEARLSMLLQTVGARAQRRQADQADLGGLRARSTRTRANARDEPPEGGGRGDDRVHARPLARLVGLVRDVAPAVPVGPARVAGVVDADHAQAQGVDRWGVAPTEHGRDRADLEVLAHPALNHERGGGADDRLAGLDRAAALAQPDRTAGALAVHDLARRDQRVTVVEDERVELEPPIWGRCAGRGRPPPWPRSPTGPRARPGAPPRPAPP